MNNLKPGIIRECSASGRKWVVVDPTSYRWLENQCVCQSPTLSDDPSPVIGLLPPTELDSTVWCERYALPSPCIINAEQYEPQWDSASAAWLSRHTTGGLYDKDGIPVKDIPVQSNAVVRFFKKYW